MSSKATLRTCKNGHRFYKSSDCPTCPICENLRKPKDSFLSLLSAPARRAMEHHNILTTEKLASYSEKEILALHGLGPASLPTLKKVLSDEGLNFKK
jgi:hypothetical protein